MGLLAKNKKRGSSDRSGDDFCPLCSSKDVGISFVDRVGMTVTHRCRACQHHWRRELVDLAAVRRHVSGHN